MTNKGLMSLAVWLIYFAYASAELQTSIKYYEVKEESDFEFAAFVPTLSDVTAEWTNPRGTSENPCVAPQPCVQFYPNKASFRLYGKPMNRRAALILTPQKPNLPSVALTMVQDTVWFPAVPGAQFTRVISFDDDVSDSLIFEFDEDIKDIIVWGAMTTLLEGAPMDFMKVEVPFDDINKVDRKLMRVTGRMQNRYQAVTVGNYGPGETTFTFVPSKTAGILRNPSQFLNWPMRSIGG
uniref:Uncharacterized protein n=1 Tax=Schistocephalus solidus TaxID=70667 RepID=A0A0X3PQT0_SCHSO